VSEFPYTDRQRRWWFATIEGEDERVEENASQRKQQREAFQAKANTATPTTNASGDIEAARKKAWAFIKLNFPYKGSLPAEIYRGLVKDHRRQTAAALEHWMKTVELPPGSTRQWPK
jgi:hypothetical protein